MSDRSITSPELGQQLGNETNARSLVSAQARQIAGDLPTPQLRSLVCPYCGTVTPDTGRCNNCAGRFDPLSRQATQNQMGPWSIRDDRLPFRPGCTYETVSMLIEQGKITSETILRGPSTRQFWTLARHAPGIAHLMGLCYSCQAQVKPDSFACSVCHAPFSPERDRQHLGLGPTRPLPGQGLPEVLALHAEPASQPIARSSQVASTSFSNHSPANSTSANSTSPSGVDSSNGSNTYLQTNSDPLQLSKQVEEASRLATRWKIAFQQQRKRAWFVLVVSCFITLCALVYALMVSNGSA